MKIAKMKVYTNVNNPLGLKVLLLAKFAKTSADIEIINLDGHDATDLLILPTIELNDGIKLFSTNAVARLLFPQEGEKRDEWLEWASTVLTPALTHHTTAGHRADSNALNVLNALVTKLDDALKLSPYLIGDKLSAADVAIFSLLAPDGTLKGARNAEHLLAWYKKILNLSEVQEVLAAYPLKELKFTALQNSNRYGGLLHIPLRVPHTNAPNVLPESGINLATTISEDEINAARQAFITPAATVKVEPRTSLPKMGERNILITSALPYVNNVPHLGNIIGCVLSADIFARYCRTVGYNTLYICGTDEYGTATETKAAAENMTPKEICDKYFELHNGIYRWFGIGFDFFGRTTHPEQTEIVHEAFKDLHKAGYVISDSVEQLLCQRCDRFLADRFVEGTCPHPGCGYEDARGDQCDKCGKLVNAIELIRPRCKVCSTAPIIRQSEQLFVDLPKIETELRSWLGPVEHGWTNNARVITQSWLREGLKPRCISRDLKWGIPVPLPGFEQKVFYVWFDAPFGYVSMTKRYTKEYKQWWQPQKGVDVELFQFMAKDNVPFHSVMWPSILLGINRGHVLVSNLMATEYLNYEDGKFSKSRGIGVFGNDAQATGIPADVWRFYLASARPEGQDSSFSWNDLAARNNSELLNNLGNFANRALVFCEKNFDSVIPEMLLTNDDLIILALINREVRGYINSLEKAKLRDGIRHLLAISRTGNGYMQAQQPWVLLKGDTEKKARAATIIGICCNICALLVNTLFPYMPTTARQLSDQLGMKSLRLSSSTPFVSMLLAPGHKIGKPAPLFTKLEQPFIDELKSKYGGIQSESNQQHPPQKLQPTTTGGKSTAGVSIAELENAIKLQGDKLRELKASTKDKKVWQPEVDKLLALKKQLTECQQNIVITSSSSATSQTNGNNRKIELEAKIAEQAKLVRNLKGSADPSVWKPQVAVLLSLKNELTTLLTNKPQ